MSDYEISDFQHKQRRWRKDLPDGTAVEVTKMVTSKNAHHIKILVAGPKTPAGGNIESITASGAYEAEIVTTIAEMLLSAAASDLWVPREAQESAEGER